MQQRFTIIGAGIAGLTAAIALRQKGLEPQVFEAAPHLRPVGAGLGLAANAIRALKALGIEKDILARGRFLEGLGFYDQRQRLISRLDTGKISRAIGEDNFTIHRADLHEQLISQLGGSPPVLNKPLENVERQGTKLLLKFKDGSAHETDYLIAADGIHSAVRRQLLPDVKPRYAGYTCWRAVVNDAAGDAGEAEEYWGPAGRFGFVPLQPGRVYWFACINAPQNDPAMKNMTAAGLLNIFRHYPPKVRAILEKTGDQPLIWGDILDIAPIRRFAYDNILLIGDAAHATTPNMGQGACQAIEDAVILAAEVARHNDPCQAFAAFEKRRRPRTRDIVKRSKMLGNMAQLENAALISLRNALMRLVPESAGRRQLKKLYEVDLF